MNVHETALSTAIEELVASKTLSLDGIEFVNKLRESSRKVSEENEKLRAAARCDTTTIENYRSESFALKSEVSALKEKISSMEETTRKGQDAIWEAKIAQAETSSFKEAMEIVFKPNTVREKIQSRVAYPNTYGSNGAMSTTYTAVDESHDRTREQGG